MDDLKLIKKHYGEKMAHLCRDLFPTVLETPGVLYTALSKTFYPTKFLYDDLDNDSLKEAFKEVVSYAIPNKEELEKKVVLKSAKELLDEAGYILYECKTEEDIQSFRHYYQRNDGIVPKYTPGTNPNYAPKEELCTFRGHRLDSCHVFFAVKKNVDEIKREDYKGKEKRQDEYGTSVISIQFSRGTNNVLSIKNRYNHTVSNPDATFSNNLENIIPGLTQAFERDYGLNIKENKSKRGIPGYVLAEDGKFYKYNIEECNVYFCPDNIIIDHSGVKHCDKSRYIVFDTFILDLKNKTMKQGGADAPPFVHLSGKPE